MSQRDDYLRNMILATLANYGKAMTIREIAEALPIQSTQWWMSLQPNSRWALVYTLVKALVADREVRGVNGSPRRYVHPTKVVLADCAQEQPAKESRETQKTKKAKKQAKAPSPTSTHSLLEAAENPAGVMREIWSEIEQIAITVSADAAEGAAGVIEESVASRGGRIQGDLGEIQKHLRLLRKLEILSQDFDDDE